jgi:hypothetical protein
MRIGPIQLIRQATPGQRRTLLAASLGWALDAFDAMLYALVLALLMRDLGMSKTTAGLLGTLTLLASGMGGILFGFLADRIGRKRALMASILTYSVCSFASGLATSIRMLAAARFVLGLGMGGEWNTGATLVAETWPDRTAGQGYFQMVQSSWAIGYRRWLRWWRGRWFCVTPTGACRVFCRNFSCSRLRSGYGRMCRNLQMWKSSIMRQKLSDNCRAAPSATK